MQVFILLDLPRFIPDPARAQSRTVASGPQSLKHLIFYGSLLLGKAKTQLRQARPSGYRGSMRSRVACPPPWKTRPPAADNAPHGRWVGGRSGGRPGRAASRPPATSTGPGRPGAAARGERPPNRQAVEGGAPLPPSRQTAVTRVPRDPHPGGSEDDAGQRPRTPRCVLKNASGAPPAPRCPQ